MINWKFISIFIIALLFTCICNISHANAATLKASPNYLIVLVHGYLSGDDAWGGDKGLARYLRNELGLEGYVYYYSFNDCKGSVIDSAHQLGDPANPKYWIGRARDDFKRWYAGKYLGDASATASIPEKAIPSKVILICHSMGGLASRYYVSSSFYGNDIKRIITLDTPHTGADIITYFKKYGGIETLLKDAGTQKVDKYLGDLKKSILKATEDNVKNSMGGNIVSSIFNIKTMDDIYRDSANWIIMAEAPRISSGIFSALNNQPLVPTLINSFMKAGELMVLGGDGYDQMDPDGDFIKNLNNADIKEPDISFRLVSARGAPTPSRELINRYYTATPYIVQQLLPYMGEYRALNNDSERYWSLLYSMLLSGCMAVKDGSIAVALDSSRGEGVSIFNKYDTKRYEILFKSDAFETTMSETKAIYDVCLGVYLLSAALGAPISNQIFFIPAMHLTYFSLLSMPIDFMSADNDSALKAHMSIPSAIKDKRDGGLSVIDKTLDDDPCIGGNIDTREVVSLISDPSATTMGYSNYKQMFALLTDKNRDSTQAAEYRSITMESLTAGNRGAQSAYIEINGGKKWVSGILVKEAPTALKGVINTFLPKKMKSFEYSENFAAWQPVGVFDEWGNFIIKKLNLAEGQNVIAFRGESWIGNKFNQILTITLNTIPMLPSGFQPAPNCFTNNNQPQFRVKFAKSAYSSANLENINITSAKLIRPDAAELDITSDIRSTLGGETYDRNILVEYTPSTPLDDGEYKIVIVANSNVGVAQALWTVNIDTRAPNVAVEPLKPYSPRSPTTIKYTATDEASTALKTARCDLYDNSGNLITEISTDEALNGGEHSFNWDPSANGSQLPADGTYKVRIKVSDLAGNIAVAETLIVIDSTPPKVLSAGITPNPLSSKSNEQKLESLVSEKSQLFIKMTNQADGSSKAYLAQATGSPADGQTGIPANYTWHYDNPYAPGLPDGIYDVELEAQDEAGNRGEAFKIANVRIDRTSPTVFAQATLPYVLSNSGANPYSTTLSYKLKAEGPVSVKIKLYHETTHELLEVWDNAPNSLSEVNQLPWSGNSADYPKGSYRFQIIASDDLGNESSSFANCVKDGIAPVISFPPEDNTQVSGVIALRGTAIDPDWTNSKPFKSYRIYYAAAGTPLPADLATPGAEWKTEAIEVPTANRGTGTGANTFTGIRPLQNDSTLAYLYTNSLANGVYTVMVVVDEDGGETLATRRLIDVQNDGTASNLQNPYIQLSKPPETVDFKSDDSVKLPIRFLNSVKPANVHLEVMRSGGPVVLYKYFPNLAGAPYMGQPAYQPGSDLGYFVWQDDYGWHVRWSSNGSHRFTGNLIGMGGDIQLLNNQASVNKVSNVISWDSSLSGGESGFDFKVEGGKQLMITPKVDEDPASPTVYASNVYLGVSKYTQEYLPIMIDLEHQTMMNLASVGGGGGQSSGHEVLRSSVNGIEWDGKLDTGGYVDNGTYIVKVRAEGADGLGISTAEAQVNITTPFELKNLETANKQFNPISAPDRVTVSFNLSKDSRVSAYVYDESNNLKATLKENEKVLGGMNAGNKYVLSWRGNYPEPSSGTVVTAGNYSVRIIARAEDGSAEKTEEVRDVSIIPTFRNEGLARIDPLGTEGALNGEKVRLAEGESPYYFEAKASGLYYPPKDFTYTLTASGKQRFTTYPYVPFAALVHRGFNRIFGKVAIQIQVHGTKKYYQFPDWHDENTHSIRDQGPYEFSLDKNQKIKGGVQWISRDFSYSASSVFGNDASYPWIRGARVKVWVYSSGGWLLDQTAEGTWVDPENGEVQTEKGVFKIKLEGEGGGASYNCRIVLKPASLIEYSRLTNRFIPWVDFVCAKRPVSREDNFAGYLDNLNKLGFPGDAYFNGEPDRAKAADAPHKNSFDSDIFSTSPSSLISSTVNGGQTILRPNLSAINSKTSTGFTKDRVDTTYKSYLSGEYLEIIPITAPEKGYFELSDGTRLSNAIQRYQGEKNPSSLNLKAVTDVKLVQFTSDENPSQTPFIFCWPNPRAKSGPDDFVLGDFEKNGKYGENGYYYNRLVPKAGGNPQSWNGYGTIGANENNCYYELDQNEINQHAALKSLQSGSGKVIYYKDKDRSEWQTPLSSVWGDIKPFNCIEYLTFGISGLNNGVLSELSSHNSNAVITAHDASDPLPWTSSDDATLYSTSGLIKSGYRLFNAEDFRGKRNINIFSGAPYQVSNDVSSAPALKYTFLKSDFYERTHDSPTDNPNLDIRNWDVEVKDRNQQDNADLELEGNPTINGKHTTDNFILKLKTDSTEKRYVEIRGSCSGPHNIQYFDGNNWKVIKQSYIPVSGTLAWWDVSRLNGKYTVLLKSGNYISTQDIYIGTLVKNDSHEKDVFSAYRRAQLKFPPQAFATDQLATITPVTMTEILVRNRPIIMTHGPIVEIKPSPAKFKTPQEDGVDLRPTLKFFYTLDDLKNLGVNPDPSDPTKNLGLNIHQITANGDLQVISNNEQTYDQVNKLYCFSGPLDHFSTYTLTKGKIKLSAPIVYADRYITNKETVSIYGTAEAGSRLEVKVRIGPLHENGEGGPAPTATVGEVGEDGKFRFENLKLLQEGNNYIYVYSSPQGNPEIKTSAELIVVRDITPPTAQAYVNLKAFSPNGDGKWDTVEYDLSSNEKGKLGFMLTAPDGKILVNQELAAETDQVVKVVWGQYGFNIYKRDAISGAWQLLNTVNSDSVFDDGSYNYVLYAIDEAGNISNNLIGKTVVDTTPPKILALSAAPNPFTPDEDGVKDTTAISYKLSEPANATIKINREDGPLFRKFTRAAGTVNYDDIKPVSDSWAWDGKGARNELLGGTFYYNLEAEDPVGNYASSEVKTVVVDRAPSLIAYAYAEPDPFSAVNYENNYTDIKYYVTRDNVQLQLVVMGGEGKTLKNLVFGEYQNKGEHSARWYGDYIPGYDGPKASNDPNKVGDGSYQFKLTAIDPDGGRPAEVSNTVMVDNVPPFLTLQPLAVDYVNKKATLTYSVPEISSLEVSVHDLRGNLIEKVWSGTKGPGSYSVSWKPITGLADQRYFKIIATDPAKNQDEKTTEMFSVVPVGELTLANVSALPEKFSPNGDGIKDQVRIAYQISGGAPEYKTNITILNAAGVTIKRLIENEPQNAGTFNFYWNGLVDSIDPANVTYAQDGIYAYRITIEDKLGTKVETLGNITLVGTRPQVNLAVEPDHLSPNNDGANDSAIFTYGIDYPAAWLTNPAQLKLDILNASSEAVFTKQFVQTAGSYTYSWDGKSNLGINNGIVVPSGQYYAYLSAVDELGTSAAPKSVILYVDNEQPAPSNFNVSPSYAKLGSKVIIKLNFDEQLAEDPKVSLILPNGQTQTLLYDSVNSNSYQYSYTIGANDPEGLVTVSLEARDLSQNIIQQAQTFVIDKTNPVISNIAISPNPAKEGNLFIDFKVNEDLGGAAVLVKQNGASALYAPLANLGNGSFRATYTVFTGYDGPASVTIEASDLAGNPSSFTPSVVEGLIVDTTAPAFTSLNRQVDNPDFSTYAKEGSVVTFSFKSSEPLSVNPDVKMNGRPMTYDIGPMTGNEYRYKYTVKNDDAEGLATLTIAGYDPAGNMGEKTTSDEAESFRIDLTNPTVAIAEPVSEMIAYPSPFSTNAAMDDPKYKRETTLRYEISEAGRVTLKVHKIANNLKAADLTRSSFTDSNVAATLIDGVLKSQGVNTQTWNGVIMSNQAALDLNNDGYADPGQYAFIVEVKDKAGNVTERKWGGTVWIQDNVLKLKEPENRSAENNPDPRFISPNGNSVVPEQKRARIWFTIDLGVTPSVTQRPERIEILSGGDISWETTTKNVGTYSVYVYDSLNNLVRTVASGKTAESGKLLYEDWNGKNDANMQVAEGIYKIVVDVKDYSNNSAMDNLLIRQVIVDNTAPIISHYSANNYYFSPGATNSSIKTTTISYEVGDNLTNIAPGEINSIYFTLSIYKNFTPVVILENCTKEIMSSGTSYSMIWDGSCGSGNYIGDANGGGVLSDGLYIFKIFVADRAGNTSEVSDSIWIDTSNPGSIIDSLPQFKNAQQCPFDVSWTGGDNGGVSASGIDHYEIQYKDGVGGSWTDWQSSSNTIKSFTLGADGHAYYFRSRAVDRAGNVEDWPSGDGDTQTRLDLATPSSLVSALPSYSTAPSFNVTWSGFDGGNNPTGVVNYDIQYKDGSGIWSNWILGATGTGATFTDGLDGHTYYFRCRVKDVAGNQEDYPISSNGDAQIRLDLITPNASIINLPNHEGSMSFDVNWSGSDGGSNPTGISLYDIQYRVGSFDASGEWQFQFDSGGYANFTFITEWNTWLAGTTANHAIFNVNDEYDLSREEYIYCFRCRAIDIAGNQGNYTTNPIGDAQTEDDMIMGSGCDVGQSIILTATPEAPSLIEPADGLELKTTRPAFKWKAPKDIYTEYSVKWAQLPNAEGDGKATKNNTSGSEKPAEAGILYFGHQMDDHFDTALERNKTYFWKVVGKKADGTEVQSNNIYSFTCNPPLELLGITNYPNPFDPTREKTKIRYKLTKDADEVTIRIYDITGALVNELTGTPFGESLNLWTKYNDIEWDGRNGRGDLVMNGIYPFEVVARLGSTSVSGRGKIAVLK